MIALGPVIFGLILGLIIGSQIKLGSIGVKFTLASFVVILIAGFIIALGIGNYPLDIGDLPFSTAFVSALIGIFVGKLLFARSK